MIGGLEALRAMLPEAARDIRVNLQTVLSTGSLTLAQRLGVALAAAAACREAVLFTALHEEAQGKVEPATVEDARAAAVLMGMNSVYYRFRNALGGDYLSLPARLRMTRLAAPASSKLDLELFSLAASAVLGCTHCMQAHERVVREAGLSAEQVHDAVRIAATVQAAAVALGLAGAALPEAARASA